jgi:hypothetical protein
MSALPSHAARTLSRHWNGRLSSYRRHLNDEHREALIAEAIRYVGFRLESELADNAFWKDVPLMRRAAVLLYLVDRGAVDRVARGGRIAYEPTPEAERWVCGQPSLTPYLEPTLALLAALRRDQAGRARAAE